MKNLLKASVSKLVILASILSFSCDRSNCVNQNPVFNQFSPNSNEYKIELLKQLGVIDTSKLTYWSDRFVETNRTKFLYAKIQSDQICATIALKIENSQTGIENLINKENISYSGAKLEGLKFSTKNRNGNIEFIFKEVKRIVD